MEIISVSNNVSTLGHCILLSIFRWHYFASKFTLKTYELTVFIPIHSKILWIVERKEEKAE